MMRAPKLLYIAFVFIFILPVGLACSARQQDGLSAVLTDDFSNPSSGWDVYTLPSGDTAAYDNGGYLATINGANRVIWFKNRKAADFRSDFTCEVSVTNMSEPGDDSECGIIFRGQDNSNFYLFRVRSSGRAYSLAKLLNDQWYVLKDWTRSDNITDGAGVNRLKVACSAANIDVYANGSKLASVSDATFSGGYIALESGTSQSGAAKYRFDDFAFFAGGAENPAHTPPAASGKIPPLFANSAILKTRELALLCNDDFSDAKSGWQVNSSGDGGYAYDDGELAVWTRNPQKGQSAYSGACEVPQDFALEMDARKLAGNEKSAMGIIFRKGAGGDMYCFLIWGDRSYTCLKRVQGTQSFLTGTETADALWSGDKSNTLGIVCAGPQIELYANGRKLQSFADNRTLAGPMTLQVVVTTDTTAETRYKFDNFKVYSVK